MTDLYWRGPLVFEKDLYILGERQVSDILALKISSNVCESFLMSSLFSHQLLTILRKE
jgi:hypothetical protein